MPTPQRENAPARLVGGITFPIERRFPSCKLHNLPAIRQPEPGACITVIRHKLQIFTACNIAVCHLERFQVNTMTRGFMVEAKAETVLCVRRIANLGQPTLKVEPSKLGRRMCAFFGQGSNTI